MAHEIDQTTGKAAIEPIDRNGAIKRILAALKRRSGRSWSVTGGRGTAYGWITIDAPPRRRTWHYADSDHKADFNDASRPFGHMGPEDRKLLGELLSISVDSQGVSIPASTGHRVEYVDRAEGRSPRMIGEQYWD